MIRNPVGLGLEHPMLVRVFQVRCLHWFCLGCESSITHKCGALPQHSALPSFLEGKRREKEERLTLQSLLFQAILPKLGVLVSFEKGVLKNWMSSCPVLEIMAF